MQFIDGLVYVFSHPLNRGQFLKTGFRVIWWKINQLFFSFPAVVPLTEKIKCICYPHLSYSGLVVYTKWPDFAEWNFLFQYLEKNHVFIDIGAHTGDYSLIAADKITRGRIFAFEPEPTVLPYLHQNIALNALEEIITVIPKAVGNKNGKIVFTLDTHSETSHLGKENEQSLGKKVKIDVTTLDAFVKQQKVKIINVLKIDVEGAEGLVFEGAKKLLKQQKVDVILFELNPNNAAYGVSAPQVFSLLTKVGYKLLTFSTPYHLKPVDMEASFSKTQNLLAIHPKLTKHSVLKKYLSTNTTQE